jgi:hypothetical protein
MVERNWLTEICTFLLSLMLWFSSSCQQASSKPDAGAAHNNHASASATAAPMEYTTQQTQSAITGTWGGDHVSMEVTETGAELQYDCAHGEITGKIAPDRDGKFSVKGTHSVEHPGPIRNGEQSRAQAVLYTGTINGETMALKVTVDGSSDVLGTFSLTHGKQVRLRRCL